MKSVLSIAVEVANDVPFAKVATEAVGLANRMGINVKFEYVGLNFVAEPKMKPMDLIETFNDVLDKEVDDLYESMGFEPIKFPKAA